VEGAEAGEAPGGHDDLLDQEVFDGADGLEVVQKGVKGLVEEFRVLAVENGVLGGEAMFEGIEAGSGFAVLGFGASAALGVGTVRIDLFLRGHKGG
jgi:hypothetical protein